MEPIFHPDSYGYRPGKSAHEAIGVTRQRCWRYNWVIDLDIKGFFDTWMQEEFSSLPFERYADDIVVHCYTEKQAQYVKERIRQRLEHCGLALHPDKTQIFYCKDAKRKDDNDHTSFDFPGYTFRPRHCRNKDGKFFVGFTPAVSRKSMKSMSYTIRQWELSSVTPLSLKDLANMINPVVRGWMNYYGAYCRSELSPILRQIELSIAKWAIRKYKKLHRRIVAATRWLRGILRNLHFIHSYFS